MAEIMNVAVLAYPGVELVDMNGPFDVFIKANRYNENRYNVFLLAESAKDIASEKSAVHITAKYNLADCPSPDIIVIPGQILDSGGFGTGSDKLIDWIKEQAKRNNVTIMSVCVGAYILAHTGLLDNRNATTHWQAISGIQEKYPDTRFIKNVRYEVSGNFITTGGVTSGIDGALYIIEMIDGPEIAQEVADVMVYNRNAPLPPGTILP